MDFNLDEYGVTVAAVQGTDFGPYVDLLGKDGLAVPHVVLTDGDILAAGEGQREGGLRRAVDLADPTEKQALGARLADLVAGDPSSASSSQLRKELVADVRSYGVFVGGQTLETDLCHLVPEALIAAYSELPHPASGATDVQAGVTNEAGTVPDLVVRAKFLRRISDLGKGRFAQRTADHIAAGDLRGRLAADPTLLSRIHVLAALDAVSHSVRGKPLLAVSDESAPE